MGQTRPVTAIKLMINDSIEMKLDKIQKKKANLAQLSLKNMTRKELMAQKVSFRECAEYRAHLARLKSWRTYSDDENDRCVAQRSTHTYYTGLKWRSGMEKPE